MIWIAFAAFVVLFAINAIVQTVFQGWIIRSEFRRREAEARKYLTASDAAAIRGAYNVGRLAASSDPPCICGTVFEINGPCLAKTHNPEAVPNRPPVSSPIRCPTAAAPGHRVRVHGEQEE